MLELHQSLHAFFSKSFSSYSWFIRDTYSPGFVTEVVDGLQGVDWGDACILKANDQVPKVFILGHAEGVLTHQDKIRLEWPAKTKTRKVQLKDELTTQTIHTMQERQ